VELKVLNWRQAVQVKTKLLLIVMSLCAPLFFSAAIRAQPIQISDDAAVLRLFLPKMGPQQRPLNLLSRSPLLVNGLKAGVVVVYDDPTTARPADYFELYDNDGDLVAVGWFDRFGIQRMAVDRGLVEEKNDLDGVFVTLLQGDSI
jgi:hypothetical protein